MKKVANFREFYPLYLDEHKDRRCRRMHFIGSALVLAVLGYALVSAELVWLWALPLIGYGFAWAGHVWFEKNRPATFSYPLYSLMADWVMFKDILTGKIRW